MIVAVVEAHLQGHLFEEWSLHREQEPIRAGGEIVPELFDAAVGVGVAASDELGTAVERYAHAGHGSSDRGIEHVRRERRGHGRGC